MNAPCPICGSPRTVLPNSIQITQTTNPRVSLVSLVSLIPGYPMT
jgi:hypothetical protein